MRTPSLLQVLLSLEKSSYSYHHPQHYPQSIASQEEAELLVSDARQMRRDYEEAKKQHLLCLEEILTNLRKLELQLFKTDLHIGRLQHLICTSGLQEVPPVIIRTAS